jgi:sortase A
VRVFREEDPLLKVGVIMMALALALVIAAIVVSVALRSEPGRVVAAEVAATKSPGEPPRYSSGEEGSATKKLSSEKSATKKSSSEKEPPPYRSGEQKKSLGYDSSSSSSGGPVGQREEEAKEEPQSVGGQEAEPPNSQSATPPLAGQQTPSEEPFEPEPQPQERQSRSGAQPQPEEHLLPGAETNYWPEPTQQELQSANNPRHYELLPGAIMSLTIEGMGIYDAPVFDSASQWTLANGISHEPKTSLPWSPTPQRNVFLAGHRMGYRGTWSRMLFYNLDKLRQGDRVVLKDRAGRTYEYRVSETFLAHPTDVWVMGQVRGRDMVTLQTCTPYPTFEKRLIVRADRV